VKKVYLETSIIGYLVAYPSRDLIKVAKQELTQEWWMTRRPFYEIYVSQLVLNEARAGDPDAARRRMAELEAIPLLDMTNEVEDLARSLAEMRVLPAKAADDIFHLALAAAHRMDFLLTWNCRHLANAELRGPLHEGLRLVGYRPPEICTPDELLEAPDV
jgi:hypothetical protein